MRVITTSDGSKTLYLEELNEHYHSRHGAITESLHVFIKNGFKTIQKSNIRVFEMGFGTGLNALLTFLNMPVDVSCYYYSVETKPLSKEIIDVLNYADDEISKEVFKNIHMADWGHDFELTNHFILRKQMSDIYQIKANEIEQFDVVYYDAFAPHVQPELWNRDILTKAYNLLNKKGILVTYCAQGQFKRTLKDIGFEVVPLPGPPGKREMTKAIKI